MIPALSALCLTCRTAYPDGWRCEDDAHVVLELRGPVERARAVEAVWGNAAARREAWARLAAARRRAYTVFGAGTAAGLAAAIATGGGVLGAISIGASGAAASVIGTAWRGRAADEFPRGGEALGPRPGGVRGRITGGAIAIAPASGEPCAAWQVVLSRHVGGAARVMLRAGATAGIALRLDGGERAEVVPGPIVITGPRLQADDPNAPGIEALVRALDPLARAADPWPPIGWDVVEEALVFVGDVVRVRGPLEPALAGAAPGSYRDAPATVLRGRGVIELERVT